MPIRPISCSFFTNQAINYKVPEEFERTGRKSGMSSLLVTNKLPPRGVQAVFTEFAQAHFAAKGSTSASSHGKRVKSYTLHLENAMPKNPNAILTKVIFRLNAAVREDDGAEVRGRGNGPAVLTFATTKSGAKNSGTNRFIFEVPQWDPVRH